MAQVIMRELLDQGADQPPIPSRCYDPVRAEWGPAVVSLNGRCTTWVHPVGADDQWTGYDGALIGTGRSTP